MTPTIRPLTKMDPFTGKDRTAAERLELAREALAKATKLLDQFSEKTHYVYPGLTERDLGIICKATEMAVRAAENLSGLGWSGYEPEPIEAVAWQDDPGNWARSDEPYPGLKIAGKED